MFRVYTYYMRKSYFHEQIRGLAAIRSLPDVLYKSPQQPMFSRRSIFWFMAFAQFSLMFAWASISDTHSVSEISSAIPSNAIHELFVSIKNPNGTLDTFDFLQIVRGEDRTRSFIDDKGDVDDYKSFQDQVILVDFWYLRCRPCIMELPGLDLLNKSIESDKFHIITFANDPMLEIEEKLLSKRGYDFRVISDVRLVTQKSYPTKILFDKNGVIVEYKSYGSTGLTAYDKLVRRYQPLVTKELQKL